ncbi:MAG: type II toxin-antitoxin system RelE/ParE family toxin [Thermosynechococcaceae cyanobacterium]
MDYQVKILATVSEDCPFEQWYLAIRDKVTRARIRARIDRLYLGNFGDAKPISEGIFELRLHFGAGYRIYFAQAGSSIIVLLGGGDKRSQDKDIQLAISLWRLYKNDPKRFQRDF